MHHDGNYAVGGDDKDGIAVITELALTW